MTDGRARFLVVATALLGCVPVLAFLGQAPLRGSSEARYARVAQLTAMEPAPEDAPGRWLVPRTDAGPHLTKPPLQYAAMAAAMRLLGDTTLAARLPGALAACATVLMLAGVAHRLHGPAVAATAAGLLAVTPLHVVTARVATTDALLALCSLGTIAAGVLARAGPRAAPAAVTAALFGGGVAVGLLTKGPVALLPAGLVLAFLRWPPAHGDAWRRLRPGLSLSLATLPVLAWAGWVLHHEPTAAALWWSETFGRVGAGADHPRPWWFLLPFFALGLLPMTAMIPLPSLLEAMAALRTTLVRKRKVVQNRRVQPVGDATFLAVASATPLMVFSMFTGKLPTYLLPCAAPLAWAVALWVASRGPTRSSVITLTLLPAAAGLAGLALTAEPARLDQEWSVVLAQPPARVLPWILFGASGCLAVPGLVWLAWRREPRLGGAAMRALGCLGFAVMVALWAGLALFEARLLLRSGLPGVLAEIRHASRLEDPVVWTAGFADPHLAFHSGHATEQLELPLTEARTRALFSSTRVLAVRPAALGAALRESLSPGERQRLHPLGTLPRQGLLPPWSGVALYRVEANAADPTMP